MTENRIAGIVVGLPLHTGGEEGIKAKEARQYGDWLAQTTTLPITFWDERFTTSVAEDFMIGADMTRKKRKQRLDMVAAQIMLQGFLTSREARDRMLDEESEQE